MEQFNTEEDELAPKENLPMVFPFEYKHYYVRKCYKSLYKLIIDALFEDSLPKTYITVTGTPGVGKSVFYNYVFRRLREAYPEKVIIVATFDKRQLQEAYIFSKEENGRRLDEAEFDLSATNYPSSIHLYDAAPKVKISELQGSKMITFTSPNASWKNSMRKVGNHKTFYADLWTLEELKIAKNLIVELKSIDDETLRKRFIKFGGVARYTICSEDVYSNGEEDLKNAIKQTNSLNDLMQYLNLDTVDPTGISHRLIYFVPENNRTSYKLEFGSVEIFVMIDERLKKVIRDDRLKLMWQLENNSKCSVFRGWLFEGEVHDVLSKGENFSCRPLQSASSKVNEQNVTLTINSECEIKPLKTRETLNEIFSKMYLKPDISNFASLDSCYFDDKESILWVFQSTLSRLHPLKTKGLLQILNVLGMLEEFKNDLISLRIVFVVPSRIEASYTLQQILTEARVPSRAELMDTFTIKGVGEKRKSVLEKKGITGDKTLYDAVKKRQTENYSCIKVAAEKFVADVDKQDLSFELETKLKNTQQFVLGLDLDYEKNSKY